MFLTRRIELLRGSRAMRRRRARSSARRSARRRRKPWRPRASEAAAGNRFRRRPRPDRAGLCMRRASCFATQALGAAGQASELRFDGARRPSDRHKMSKVRRLRSGGDRPTAADPEVRPRAAAHVGLLLCWRQRAW